MAARRTALEYPGHPQLSQTQAREDGLLSARNIKIFLAVAVLVGAFGYFAFVAFQSAARFYYTVGEVHESARSGQMVRVSGKLVPDSFQREEDSTLARFSLTDGTQTLAAIHDGVVPDLFFNEHSEIILEGALRPDGVFESHDVTVKCPSKYIASS